MTDEERLTPKQKRELRQQFKEEQQQEKRARLLSRPEFQITPRIQTIPIDGQPRVVEDPGSIMRKMMEWNSDNADVEGSWPWGRIRQWADHDWHGLIYPNLCSFQDLTWSQILDQRTGRRNRHKKHHDMDVCTIRVEAVDRWLDLGLEEYDTIFRFRLLRKARLWGYRNGSKFFLIWWDEFHEIYPLDN